MKNLLFIISMLASSLAISQPEAAQARFDGNLNRTISSKIKYPVDLASQHIDGFAVISFNITDTGEVDSVVVEESPHGKLTDLALFGLGETVGKWSPATLDGIPQTERYKVVVNYSVQNQMPSRNIAKDYYEKAKTYFEKGKYDKSLGTIEKAIKENPYYAYLFEFRATVNKALGRLAEAEEDAGQALAIKKEVLTVCDVFVVGVVRKVDVAGKVVARPSNQVGW